MSKLFFKSVKTEKELASLPFCELKAYHWESSPPYRPKTFAKVCVFGGNLRAILKCFENNPKADVCERDGRIWCDSCLEFFVRPLSCKDEYINIEVNSKGFFLSQFGASRENRRFIKELTSISPLVDSFKGSENGREYWGVDITVSKELIASLYGVTIKDISFKEIYANFYKCGDECETPHYMAMFPVTTLPPGFHNPQCFKKLILNQRKEVEENV